MPDGDTLVADPESIRTLASTMQALVADMGEKSKAILDVSTMLGETYHDASYEKLLTTAQYIVNNLKGAQAAVEAGAQTLNAYADAVEGAQAVAGGGSVG